MNQNQYDPKTIEAKWAKIWEEKKTFQVDIKNAKKPFGKPQGKPFYNLAMFPYPSGEGLHVGHIVPYSGVDTFGRYKRMKGYDVFEPMGFDSFGIHSENYAIKQGKHPRELTEETIKYFRDKQMRRLGTLFDWDHQVITSDPDYYKWTQWIFVQMFKHGLAEKKTSFVTYCSSCKTVLSDEQTETKDGVVVCERCKTPIERREMKQWFFKITKYAERLLNNLSKIDWSERTKLAQKNWIGRSEGALIEFKIQNENFKNTDQSLKFIDTLEVFTTRPDTLFGATFMVVAPEHEFIKTILHRHAELVSASQKIPKRVRDDKGGSRNTCNCGCSANEFGMTIYEELKKYVQKASTKTEQERITEGKNKSGVFSGFYAINPVNKEKIPIWVADYVVMGYGTGAIMAVPAHDQRDFDFAKKYDLPIRQVIENNVIPAEAGIYKNLNGSWIKSRMTNELLEKAYVGEGKLVNSGEWNGREMPREMDKVIHWLEERNIGKKKTTYKLRDWCISRQRYWGPPIPVIHCSDCESNGLTYYDMVKNSHSEAKPKNLAKRNTKDIADARSFTPFRMTDRKGMTINKEDFQDMPGWFPVPESKLPVLLPETEDYLPDGSGKSPLARIPEFAQTKCPYCGGVADRETDVSDTFLDSSWYFLRYPSVNVEDRGLDIGVEGRKSIIEKDKIYPPSSNLQPLSSTFHHQSSKVLPWDPEITRKWLPVDMYIGGQEHAVLHLMYARFVTMALHDMGYIDFDEPYTRFFAHGLMIKEGFKMSKSRGNVVNPVKYLDLYGSDCLRMYVLFMGPYDQKMDFRDSGIDGMYRFLGRVYTWVQKEISNSQFPISNEFQNLNDQIKRKLHRTIKEVGEDIEKLHFNTAIAKLMELLNEATKPGVTYVVTTSEESLWIVKTYLKLLAPFAPFISEELWQVVTGSVADFSATSLRASPPASARKKSSALSGTFPSAPPVNNKWSIHQQSWPIYDENLLYEENVTIVVQVNGKVRDTFQTEYRGASNQKQVEGEAKKSEKIQKYLEGKKIIKIIFIPGKVVNFVVE